MPIHSRYLKDQSDKMNHAEIAVFLYFIVMAFQYPFEYYSDEGILPAKLVLYAFIILLWIFPLLMFWFNRPNLTPYRAVFLVVFSGIFLMSIWNGVITNYTGIGVISGIGVYLSMLSAFCMCNIRTQAFEKAFVCLTPIALAVLAGVLLFGNIDIQAAMDRDYTWTPIFFTTSFFWAYIPFLLLSFITKKHIVLSVLYWAGALILNSLFLKRMIFVDTALIAIVVLFHFLGEGKIEFLKVLKFCLAILLLGGLATAIFWRAIGPLVMASVGRLFEISGGLLKFDRFVESFNYFKAASPLEILLGKGFYGQHEGLGLVRYALHVGWSNFILKGGIPLFLLVFIPYFKLLYLLPKYKYLPVVTKFSICMMMVYAAGLFYGNMHSFTPNMLLFFYSVFNVMDYRGKQAHCRELNSIYLKHDKINRYLLRQSE